MNAKPARTRQPADPWADWALEFDATPDESTDKSDVQAADLGVRPASGASGGSASTRTQPGGVVDAKPGPRVDPKMERIVQAAATQWAPAPNGASSVDEALFAPPLESRSEPAPRASASPASAGAPAARSIPGGTSQPEPMLEPRQPAVGRNVVEPNVNLVEDFTGEFDDIESGEWDDEPYRYLDDTGSVPSPSAPVQTRTASPASPPPASSSTTSAKPAVAPREPERTPRRPVAPPNAVKPVAEQAARRGGADVGVPREPSAQPGKPGTLGPSRSAPSGSPTHPAPAQPATRVPVAAAVAGVASSGRSATTKQGRQSNLSRPSPSGPTALPGKAAGAKPAQETGLAGAVVAPRPKRSRRRRAVGRVGIALVSLIALATGYVTWQFATLRRNQADSQVLDLPGRPTPIPSSVAPTGDTLPPPATSLVPNNLDAEQVGFDESLTPDTLVNPTVSTTPVSTIPGQGSCDDDPACANAPVVVLPEVEKPKAGALLVDRVAVEPLGGVNAQNILLIGSDSRADVPDAQKSGFGSVGGNRSDTIIVLRISPDGKDAALLSFPRDTFVHLAGTNKNDRINSAYAKGVNSLVRTIQENFNLPINHVAEIDFAGFQKIVGTLGGIEICFDHPARDKVTKLDVDAGCQLLNETQATAFVRSRHYEQLINGVWKSDGRGDIGRVQRQQRFIKQVLEKVIGSGGRNPITAQALIGDLKSAVTLDKTYGITELYGTAKTFSAFEPNELQGFTLPTSAARIDGKAVLRVRRAEASQVVALFGQRG